MLVKFRPANTFCLASFLNKAAEAHLTPLTITFPPLKPASPLNIPHPGALAYHLLSPSRLSFASSMQISGCGQVSVSCVQAVSPIAQGDVHCANRFYYYCTKRINSFSSCTAMQTVSAVAIIVQTISTIASTEQTMHLEKLTWAGPAKTGRVAKDYYYYKGTPRIKLMIIVEHSHPTIRIRKRAINKCLFQWAL